MQRDTRRRRPEEPERRATPQRRTKAKRSPLTNSIVYLVVVVAISMVLAAVGWSMANDMLALNKTSTSATITVEDENDFGSVVDQLKTNNIIEHTVLFRLFAAVTGGDDEIAQGTYVVDSDMDYRALLNSLSSSSSNRKEVEVTITEGMTVQQIFQLLEEEGVSTVDKLNDMAANHDYAFSFLQDIPLGDPNRLEGYLFPDTYEFYVGEQSSSALTRLLKNFETKMMNDEMKAKVESSGHSLQEIVTIASLIEKETDGTDQANIASVIYNRLADTGSHGTYGMLNIDASLLYGLPEDHTGGLTNEDKEYDSPYNLYKYAGLPPTPIANPGLAALQAALEPASTNYYYYALGKDGKHHFSTTLEEHNAFLNSGEYGG